MFQIKSKKYLLFYLLDIIFILTNIVLALCENFNKETGYAALTSLGRFVMFCLFALLGIICLIIVSIIQFKKKEQKEQYKKDTNDEEIEEVL